MLRSIYSNRAVSYSNTVVTAFRVVWKSMRMQIKIVNINLMCFISDADGDQPGVASHAFDQKSVDKNPKASKTHLFS